MAQDPLHLLCIEPAFPGRLGAIADWLVRRRGYHCRFCCTRTEPQEFWPPSTGKGLEVILYNLGGVARESSVAWNRVLERGLCYAYGCWELLEARRFRPIDLVLGRSAGLGSTLYFPVFQPGTPIVNLFDYYYHPHAYDLAEEAASDMPAEYFHWRRAANAMDLLDLENGVTPWTLTEWQKSLFPKEYQRDFWVLFDGADTQRFPARRPEAGQRTILGRAIPPETRVVTFVARHLEQLRGFDRFRELINRLMQAGTDILAVVVGGTPVQRGLDVRFFNKDYREFILSRTPPSDPDRVWFLGAVAQATVVEVLQASDLHVYASRPYPVSRSLVEALAAGCVVLAPDIDPVREFITNGQTGYLVPHGNMDAWEDQARIVLEDPAAHRGLGEGGAAMVRSKFARDVTLPNLAREFDKLLTSD